MPPNANSHTNYALKLALIEIVDRCLYYKRDTRRSVRIILISFAACMVALVNRDSIASCPRSAIILLNSSINLYLIFRNKINLSMNDLSFTQNSYN